MGRAPFERRPELRLAIELFFRGEAVSEQDFRKTCSTDVFDALCSIRLVLERLGQPGQLVSPVRVYPIDGFVLVSDRFEDPEGAGLAVPDDVTFCALNSLTLQFLLILPDARGGDAINLCGGCGVGALRLARTARTSASADLTERAAFYADFNARLNSVEMASLCGDLYAPAGNRQFDVVGAHPPFIPAVSTDRTIFSDADAFGESIARRIVEELPARLRVGGTAVVSFGGSDTAKPIEVRIEEWLGDAAGMFDIVFGEYRRKSIEEMAQNIRHVQHGVSNEAVEGFVRDVRAWGAREHIHGVAMFRRLATVVSQPPLRVKITEQTQGTALQQVLDWRDARQQPDFAARISLAKPRSTAHLEMNVRYATHGGKLALADVTFTTTRGILGKAAIEPWIAPWMVRFDGALSVADVYAAARTDGAFPQEFAPNDFGELVSLMLMHGFLEAKVPDRNVAAQTRLAAEDGTLRSPDR